MSGGEELARCVAEKLGWPAISREVIVETASQYGVSEQLLVQQLQKSPGIIDKLAGERRIYLAAIQTTLAERALKGDFVYHGHAGHFLLKGLPGVLKVRIIAPLEYRIRKLKEKENLSPQKARDYIKNIDKQRTDWTRFLYGEDWTDSSLYDLVINIQDVTIATACEIVAHAVGQPEFRKGPEHKRSKVNFYLACLVKSKLALDKKTTGMDLDVTAVDGEVSISGKFYTSGPFPRGMQRSKTDIVDVVQAVPGVKGMNIDLEALSTPVE